MSRIGKLPIEIVQSQTAFIIDVDVANDCADLVGDDSPRQKV